MIIFRISAFSLRHCGYTRRPRKFAVAKGRWPCVSWRAFEYCCHHKSLSRVRIECFFGVFLVPAAEIHPFFLKFSKNSFESNSKCPLWSERIAFRARAASVLSEIQEQMMLSQPFFKCTNCSISIRSHILTSSGPLRPCILYEPVVIPRKMLLWRPWNHVFWRAASRGLGDEIWFYFVSCLARND